jgi:hypothetical protein
MIWQGKHPRSKLARLLGRNKKSSEEEKDIREKPEEVIAKREKLREKFFAGPEITPEGVYH